MVHATEDDFKRAARSMLQRAGRGDFASLFGTTPAVCAHIWNLLDLDDLPGAEMQHLLWGLHHMKTNNDDALCFIANVSRGTLRQWCQEMINRVALVGVEHT